MAGESDRSREARPAAVVVGLDCITGLQSARLLGARGIPVIGVAADPRHFCARTRVARRVVRSQLTGEALITTLERLAGELPEPGIAVLVPCTDAAVLAISRWRDRLTAAYRFVLPEHDVLDLLVDKVRFAEHASAAGLAIPPTAIVRSRDDALAAAARLTFPAVLKPPLKTPRWFAGTSQKAIRVETPDELLAVYEVASGWADVLIVQSWVEGGEENLYSCNGYFDRSGEPVVTFIARKIRQWPLDTGTSSLGVEVRDETVLEESLRLFRSVGYRGLAYLEMKRDARTGAYAIIEPNLGRPTGRSSIAERGGVELLLTAYRDALGEPIPPLEHRTQRFRGVKWIYWRHDLQASVVRWRRGELGAGEWLRSVRGAKIEAVGSVRDPVPFLLDVGGAMGTAWSRVTRRARRRLDRGALGRRLAG